MIHALAQTPKGVYLWKFKINNLWTFMAHLWIFLTKPSAKRKYKSL